MDRLIVPHGDVEHDARETYGGGKVFLRVGNGGAGATGLVQALANDFLSTLSAPVSIAWICNHSRNTQVALHRNYIDLALTYEREQEALATFNGLSVTAGCVFHDHFCIAGPTSDPADIRSAKTAQEAFARIAMTRCTFHSRADGSATMRKERQIWAQCHLEPWDNASDAAWYHTSQNTPSEALANADKAEAYLLTDRSTLLRQTIQQTIAHTTVFVEATSPNDLLMNSCYALYSPTATVTQQQNTRTFLKYLLSDQGQDVIAAYGTRECGLPLFAPVRDGFAKSSLRGGIPRKGRWTVQSAL